MYLLVRFEIGLCTSISDLELGKSNYITFKCDRNTFTSNPGRGCDALIAVRKIFLPLY